MENNIKSTVLKMLMDHLDGDTAKMFKGKEPKGDAMTIVKPLASETSVSVEPVAIHGKGKGDLQDMLADSPDPMEGDDKDAYGTDIDDAVNPMPEEDEHGTIRKKALGVDKKRSFFDK